MYVNCQGALAIKIWPGIFILKNCEVHQNQKNGTKQPNGYILSAYLYTIPLIAKISPFITTQYSYPCKYPIITRGDFDENCDLR